MDVSYKLNFENPDNYRFGNTFNANVSGFYEVPTGNNLFVPYVRSSMETADYDQMNEMEMNISGGIIWWNGAGTEFHFVSFILDLTIVLTSVRQLNGKQPENDFRGLASLNYNF